MKLTDNDGTVIGDLSILNLHPSSVLVLTCPKDSPSLRDAVERFKAQWFESHPDLKMIVLTDGMTLSEAPRGSTPGPADDLPAIEIPREKP